MTHQNYNNTIELFFKNYSSGDKIIFGTHNIDSLTYFKKMQDLYGEKNNIFCGQGLGIALHSSAYSLNLVLYFLF